MKMNTQIILSAFVMLSMAIIAANGAVPLVNEDYPDTTVDPVTTLEPTTPTPPNTDDFFDGLSFCLGILSSVVIFGVAYGVWKYYLSRRGGGSGYMSL